MGFSIYEWGNALIIGRLVRRAEPVGKDAAGNAYYRDRKTKGTKRERRWVRFAGKIADASLVEPEWHAWLHHQTDTPPGPESPYRQRWVKEHRPNLSGTPEGYHPPGSTLTPGGRGPTTGDYEPWQPS